MPESARTPRVKLVFCLAALALAAGCSRDYYKRSADREVYTILEQKSAGFPEMPARYTVEQDTADVLAGCPRAGVEPVELPTEAAPPALAEEATPEQVVVISLEKALQIATLNSRDYQTQKEALYLTALALTLERYRFDSQWFWILSGRYDNTNLGDTTQVSGESDLGFERLFKSGTQLSVSLATTLSQFLRGRPDRAASSLLRVNVTQPLLRGAGVAVSEPLTQAERDVIYQVRDFIRFRRTFFVRVLSDYYRVLEQRQILENERINYENLSLTRDWAESLGQAGRMAEFQVDQIRQDELQAENGLVTARQTYQNLLDQFKITLGLPTETGLVLDERELTRLTEEGVIVIELALEAIEQIALAHRLDLMSRGDRRDDAERKVEVAANDLLPGLDLSAGLAMDTEGEAQPLNFQADRLDLSAGFELDLPLDRLSERNAFRRRLIELQRAMRNHTELRDQVVRDVRNAWRQYERARRSYQIQRESVKLAERRVESTMLLLEAGRADARDVLEAREALLRAQNALARALVDYRVASLELARDMGILQVGEQGQLKEAFDEYE